MDTTIEVFEKNQKTVTWTCTAGLASLSGYTATLTVKNTLEDTEDDLISVEGDIADLVVTFDVTKTLNALTAKKYFYEITLVSTANNYTVAQGYYEVKKSLKF